MVRISFLLLALVWFAIGLRLVISRRPFIIGSKNLFWILTICLLPRIFYYLQILLKSVLSKENFSTLDYANLLSSVGLITILIILWVNSKGYTIFGVTENSLNQSLVEVLEKLGLPFEKILSKWNLTSINVCLEILSPKWVIPGKINVIPKNKVNLIDKIIFEINNYFIHSNANISKVTCYSYVFTGIFMVLLATYLLML